MQRVYPSFRLRWTKEIDCQSRAPHLLSAPSNLLLSYATHTLSDRWPGIKLEIYRNPFTTEC